MDFLQRLQAGLSAFRESYFSSSTKDRVTAYDFDSYMARLLRYRVYWAMYENTQYRDIHSWANALKTSYGLYRHIRGIYNPTYRLVEFYREHLWGGLLDLDAGNGDVVPSALPIVVGKTAKEAQLREAIGAIWQWSNWQTAKNQVTFYGSMCGDVALAVVDDPENQRVYLDPVDPASIADITLDKRGFVTSYALRYFTADPENATRVCEYQETAKRDEDKVGVKYATFKDGSPYPWNESKGTEWEEPNMPFVPFVLIKHSDVGRTFGWSELHPGRTKIQELDDLASKTHDHIRKSVDPIWLFSGVAKRAVTLERATSTPTDDRPQPERDELPALYAANPQATAKPLVAELHIDEVVKALKEMQQEIERDYPELQVDVWRAIQTNSGRALRLARQRAESKVQERRINYDNGLVQAHQMAISLAAIQGYGEVRGFSAESFANGELDHTIGKRTVFSLDPLDDLELEKEMLNNLVIAVKGGIPADLFLERHGWPEKDIARVLKAVEDRKAMAATIAGGRGDKVDKRAGKNGDNQADGQPPADGKPPAAVGADESEPT